MRKKIGKFLMAVGTVLVACAVVLAFYNSREDKNAGTQSKDILSELESYMSEPHSRENQVLNEDESDSTDVQNYGYGVGYDGMQSAFFDGYGYIGVLTFPTLNLELPVMDTWDYTRLRMAPCLYYGSVQSENMVIAGHNYTSHFGKLSNLRIGDEVGFTDMNGRTYKYVVADIEQLHDYDTELMIDSGWPLSLYTCDYSGINRITIRCSAA